MLKKIAFMAASALLFSSAFASTTTPIEASHVKIQSARVELAKMGPLGQAKTTIPSTEAKMDIINTGDTPVTVIAATTPVATQVQLHEFTTVDGKKIMEQIDYIKINPKSDDDLSYNGVHIMLIGLKQPLKAREEIPLTIIFADGSHIQVNAKVAANTPNA